MGITNEEVVNKVCSGLRESFPANCPKEISEIMQGCWLEDEEARLTFDVIRGQLSSLLPEDTRFRSATQQERTVDPSPTYVTANV